MVIEKICSLKYLKKFDLRLEKLNNKDIYEIKCENTSIIEMNIIYNKEDFDLFNLQEKFPNLTNIFINLQFYKESLNPKYEIVENSKSKVKNIDISIYYSHYSFKIYCQSYEKLESIKFNIPKKEIYLPNLFPIFNNNCKVIFKCLKLFDFKLSYTDISFDLLNNIYNFQDNNIDNMPNLIDFSFVCSPKIPDIEFQKKFVRKVLSMKFIKRITIGICKEYKGNYSKTELRKIFPDINLDNLYEINIRIFDSKSCTIF